MDVQSFNVNGSEVDMPAYMYYLTQEDINIVTSKDDRSRRIIAAGVHPDGSVLLVTGEPEVKIFNPTEYYVPPGLYIPDSDGATVFLPGNKSRWPGGPGFTVDSVWLLEHSKPALNVADVSVGDTYLGEIDIETTSIDNS